MARGHGVALVAAMVVMMSTMTAGYSLVNFMSIERSTLPNIPGVVQSLNLTSLLNAVVQAGLADTLSSPGPFTVFGPENKAFEEIPDWLKKRLENVTELANLLKFHVVPGYYLAANIQNELLLETAASKAVRLNTYSEGSVVTAQCAPIDLDLVDQKASNGVVHVLNKVMIPPVGSIAEVVPRCPIFSTLVTALKKANLVDVLNGKGPFTVFAPTDDAFAEIDKQTLDDLLANVTALTDVLKYHVASGTYCSSGLVTFNSLQMLNNQAVNIAVEGGAVKVNDATVLANGVDGSVTNGVVHTIDTVLMPPGFTLKPQL